MAEENRNSPQEIGDSLRENTQQMSEWLRENKANLPSETFEQATENLKAATEALDNQKIYDAQQKLISIKGQLEGLLNSGGRENPDVRRALDTLNQIVITDAASAGQAQTAMNVGAQTSQEAGGEEIQQAAGYLLGGLAALAMTPELKNSMLAFGKSLGIGDKDSERGEQNLKSAMANLDGKAFFAELNNGVTKNDKAKDVSQATGIAL